MRRLRPRITQSLSPPCSIRYGRANPRFRLKVRNLFDCAVAPSWRLFYTHSFATRKALLANSSADFRLRGRNYRGCRGGSCLVVRVPAVAATGRRRDAAGPAKGSDRGARPLGRAAHSRELRERFGGGAGLRDGPGPPVADGLAAAGCARAALGNPGSAHADDRQGISHHGVWARGGARFATNGSRVARNYGGLRSRGEPVHRIAQ